MSEKFLIVIAGPTAVGKTTTAIKTANALDTEIISCDSRQLYKELNIGVAKPSSSELAQAKHHFIDHISISDHYSAGRYEREAIELLDKLFKLKKYVILTGGTGLYIKAILEGLDEFPEVAAEDIKHYNEIFKREGIESLQRELKIKDPSYFNIVDIQNSRRLLRALSVIKSSGKTFSSFRSNDSKKRNFNTIAFKLSMDRKMLYERINHRVDKMIENGLINEVKSLVKHKDLQSLQTVGYTELFDYLSEKIDLKEALRLIKRNTRRYAKRQMTWLNNQTDFITTNSEDIDFILDIIANKSK